MIEELNKILKVIESLDKHIKKEIISKKKLKEEQANLNDFVELHQDIKKNLEELNKIDADEPKKVLMLLADLNMNFHSVIWHLEQLHELIKKMIICYGEKTYRENAD